MMIIQAKEEHMFATLPKCYDLINECAQIFLCEHFQTFFINLKVEKLTNLIIIMVCCLTKETSTPKRISHMNLIFFSSERKKHLFISDIFFLHSFIFSDVFNYHSLWYIMKWEVIVSQMNIITCYSNTVNGRVSRLNVKQVGAFTQLVIIDNDRYTQPRKCDSHKLSISLEIFGGFQTQLSHFKFNLTSLFKRSWKLFFRVELIQLCSLNYKKNAVIHFNGRNTTWS